MKYVINSYTAVGPIIFGMARDEVWDIAGKTPVVFKKSQASDRETDDFGDFHVYYDANGRVEAVEFFNGLSEVLFDKQNLFALPRAELNRFLIMRDSELMVESDSMISCKHGIAVYAPGWKLHPNATAESVLMFKKGYYDAT
jgi:hypothetical protein